MKTFYHMRPDEQDVKRIKKGNPGSLHKKVSQISIVRLCAYPHKCGDTQDIETRTQAVIQQQTH